MSIIEVKNLSHTYDNGYIALKNINLSIEEHSFVAVLGHNGSGKSTLAKHFNGILTATEGKVTVAGIDCADEERLSELRRTVGMVFQNPDNQIIATVVEEDVAFALENLGVPYDEMHREVEEVLSTVGMSEYAKHSTSRLSGGQKQRIAIAGVIAMKPRILVLDEPTAMLDPIGRADMMTLLKKLHDDGMTVILITHFMNEAAQADRIIVINEGETALDGTPEEVFSHGDYLRSIGLEVPQSTELMTILRENGLDVPETVVGNEDCIKIIERLLK